MISIHNLHSPVIPCRETHSPLLLQMTAKVALVAIAALITLVALGTLPPELALITTIITVVVAGCVMFNTSFLIRCIFLDSWSKPHSIPLSKGKIVPLESVTITPFETPQTKLSKRPKGPEVVIPTKNGTFSSPKKTPLSGPFSQQSVTITSFETSQPKLSKRPKDPEVVIPTKNGTFSSPQRTPLSGSFSQQGVLPTLHPLSGKSGTQNTQEKKDKPSQSATVSTNSTPLGNSQIPSAFSNTSINSGKNPREANTNVYLGQGHTPNHSPNVLVGERSNKSF